MLIIIMSITAQEIKGELKLKGDDLVTGVFSIDGKKGETYTVELWAAPAGSNEYVKIEGIKGKMGPGLSMNAYEEISFGIDILPPHLSGNTDFKFKVFPDNSSVWSKALRVAVPDSGLSGSWFNENLLNNSYLTFGITSVSDRNGRLILNFMMTNMHRANVDIAWDRNEAVMLRVINKSNVEQIIYSGNLWFDGAARGNFGNFTLPAQTTIEGFIEMPISFNLIKLITSGVFRLNAQNGEMSFSINLGLIE